MEVVVPLHVSGIWIAKPSEDPLKAGSIGAGINLALYARAVAAEAPCEIQVNGLRFFVDQARSVCEETGAPVKTQVKSPVGLGKGFGLSAATLISHSIFSHIYAGKPLTKAFQLAHVLEVKYSTGLGDVIAEWLGGIVVRVVPGAPGVGYAYRILPRQRVVLVVAELGTEESTSHMLARIPTEVYATGEKLLREFIETEDLLVFFENSRRFTSTIFDYSTANQVVSHVKGIIGYYLKKSALVMWIEREFASSALEELHKRGIKAFVTTISQIGASIVHTTQPSQKNQLAYQEKAS